MDARCLAAGMLSALLIAGCSSGGNTELMERELRLQEDRIYYLEDELARCCEAMQGRQEELAASGHSPKSVAPARRPTSAPPTGNAPVELPKVELELPSAPAPLNSLPSLFEPNSPASDDGPGTAMRIVRPAPPPAASAVPPRSEAAGQAASAPPRMRFASALADPAPAASPRVVMQWSAAPGDREPAETSPPAPRTAVSSGALRRPQWSPYR